MMTVQKRIYLILLLFALPLYQVSAGTLHEKNTILSPDGRIRYFHFYVPERRSVHPALVILLHGGTQDYTQILRPNSAQREWLKLADENQFLLIIPNGVDAETGKTDGTNQHWNDCRADAGKMETGADDVGFISSLIDWAIREYRIDPSRVYVTGASNGGMMSYRLATELGKRIAGVAAFVANLPKNSECTPPRQPISVFICNGTSDRFVPWSGGNIIRDGGQVVSARETRDFWIRHNRTETVPSIKKYPDLDPEDDSTVRSEQYGHGRQQTEVMFYTVTGGGHNIPSIYLILPSPVEWLIGPQNHDIEGARQAWNFLKRHHVVDEKP